MLASSPTMSASGTDQISGTNAKIIRPSPGPTEWISVSVVYGPPDVEKKRTNTSPSVPISRGSFRLINHASITKRTKLHQTTCFRLQRMRSNGQAFKAGRRLAMERTLETLLEFTGGPKPRNIVAIVNLCDLRV